MDKWTKGSAIAAPLMKVNVETGVLGPVFVTKATAISQGDRLFAPWRYDDAGNDNPDFVLNQERYKQAQILVSGKNFGCGSSREIAVWGLTGYGFKCVIAPTFGEIFYDNSFQNGLLLIELPEEVVNHIALTIERSNHPEVSVDLVAEEITLPGGEKIPFKIPPARRDAMLGGLDELSMLRGLDDRVEAFRGHDRTERPWVYGRESA